MININKKKNIIFIELILIIILVFITKWSAQSVDYFDNTSNGGMMRSRPWGIEHNNVVYITYQSLNNDPYVIQYDPARGKWSNKIFVGDNPFGYSDAHGSPIIFLDKNNYFHVFYGAHATPMHHAKSTNPLDITSWIDLGKISEMKLPTYPTAIVLKNGTVIIFYRSHIINYSHGAPLAYVSSTDDDAESWHPQRILFNFTPELGNGYRIYPSYYLYDNTGSDEIIYFDFVRYSGWEKRYDIYFAYFNASDGNVYCLNNNRWINLGANINLTAADRYCRIVDVDDKTGGDTSALAGFVRQNNTFHILYKYSDLVHSSYFNNTNWVIYNISSQTAALSIYIENGLTKAVTGNESGKYVFNFNGTGWELNKTFLPYHPIAWIRYNNFSETYKLILHEEIPGNDNDRFYMYDMINDCYFN